jgi:hypothetical protein
MLICFHDYAKLATVLRLTGLPPISRYPIATVTRDGENISIHFGGLSEEQTMNVPLKYVGGDEEEAELRLLARLQEIGYQAQRGS